MIQNLVESVRKGEYNLIQSNIQQMARITREKSYINITMESTTKAKVTKRGNNSTMNHTCKGCNKKCTTNIDFIHQRRQFHKQNNCPHCKKTQYGRTQDLMTMQNNVGKRHKTMKIQQNNKHQSQSQQISSQ